MGPVIIENFLPSLSVTHIFHQIKVWDSLSFMASGYTLNIAKISALFGEVRRNLNRFFLIFHALTFKISQKSVLEARVTFVES